MTVVYVDVRHQELLARPLFGGKLTSAEALQNYVRTRWPTGTAKAVARAWDLTLDEAKGIVAGRASRATIDKVYEPERGGWPVALCVLGGVIGQGVAEFFAQEARRAADEAERARRDAESLAAAEQAAGAAILRLVGGGADRLRHGLAGHVPGEPAYLSEARFPGRESLGSQDNIGSPQEVGSDAPSLRPSSGGGG